MGSEMCIRDRMWGISGMMYDMEGMEYGDGTVHVGHGHEICGMWMWTRYVGKLLRFLHRSTGHVNACEGISHRVAFRLQA